MFARRVVSIIQRSTIHYNGCRGRVAVVQPPVIKSPAPKQAHHLAGRGRERTDAVRVPRTSLLSTAEMNYDGGPASQGLPRGLAVGASRLLKCEGRAPEDGDENSNRLLEQIKHSLRRAEEDTAMQSKQLVQSTPAIDQLRALLSNGDR